MSGKDYQKPEFVVGKNWGKTWAPYLRFKNPKVFLGKPNKLPPGLGPLGGHPVGVRERPKGELKKPPFFSGKGPPNCPPFLRATLWGFVYPSALPHNPSFFPPQFGNPGPGTPRGPGDGVGLKRGQKFFKVPCVLCFPPLGTWVPWA